jgi:hypothetical protein
MNVPFHIDQINEVLKYLDDVPHKFSRGLVDYIKNHVENHVKQTENDSKEVTTEVEQVIS